MSKSEVVTVEAIETQVAITPMSLIQQAQDKGSSVEQMKQLFDLQIRWEENEAKKAYNEAVAKFKCESISIGKDKAVGYKNKDGSFTGYTHASIGNVVSTIIPFLAKHGLSHRWDTKQENGDIAVTCKLTHGLGYSEQTTLSAKKDDTGKKNAIQQVASTITYLQRYTLLALVGLSSSDHDDDGVGSEESVEYITESQVCDLESLVAEVEANTSQLFEYLTIKCKVMIEDIAGIPVQHFDFVVKVLESKRSK